MGKPVAARAVKAKSAPRARPKAVAKPRPRAGRPPGFQKLAISKPKYKSGPAPMKQVMFMARTKPAALPKKCMTRTQCGTRAQLPRKL